MNRPAGAVDHWTARWALLIWWKLTLAVRAAIVETIRQHVQPNAQVSWSRFAFDFSGATLVDASFRGAAFSGDRIVFDGVTFSGGTVFDGAMFSDWTSFDGSTFVGFASFEDASFSGCTTFHGTSFDGDTDFAGAAFSDFADFSESTFVDVDQAMDGVRFGRPEHVRWGPVSPRSPWPRWVPRRPLHRSTPGARWPGHARGAARGAKWSQLMRDMLPWCEAGDGKVAGRGRIWRCRSSS